MERFLQIETLIIALLLLASLIAAVVQRFRVPYTVVLVVVGLLITFQPLYKFEAPPEIIPALFLPPLAFVAAFRLNLSELRHNQFNILAWAVLGVIASALIVGGLLTWAVPLVWPVALVFGALIAATDPMAFVSLFRTLRVPKRLANLVEGESLFNNGTAIVFFNLILVALTGQFHLLTGTINFVQVAAGSIIIGLVLGWLTAQVIARVDDYLIRITLTMVLAFGTYLMAERLNVSGAPAVIIAGLMTVNVGPQGISPTTRLVIEP